MRNWGRALEVLLVVAFAALASAAASRVDDDGGLTDAVGTAGATVTQFTQFHPRSADPSAQNRAQDMMALDNRFLGDAQQKVQTLLDRYQLEGAIRFAYTNPEDADYAAAVVRKFANANLMTAVIGINLVEQVIEDANRAVNPESRSADNARAYADALHAVRAFRDVTTGELRGS